MAQLLFRKPLMNESFSTPRQRAIEYSPRNQSKTDLTKKCCCGMKESFRGVFSARVPDSSVDGVPVGFCPDDGHMEEEVQLRVQVEEEDRRNNTEKDKVRNRESKNRQHSERG